MQNQVLHLDNSRRHSFHLCPFKFDAEYNRGIDPVNGSTALRYGTTFHAGMEGFYSHIQEHGWSHDGGAIEQAIKFAAEAWNKESELHTFYDDYRTFENFSKAFMLYLNHFADDEKMLEVVNTERVFKIEIHPGLVFTGRLDLEMILNGSKWINEFKTTGKDISYVSRQQDRDPQFVGYSYAISKLYPEHNLEGILVTYHHLSAYKNKKTGDYGEAKILFDRIPQFFTEQDFFEWKQALMFAADNIQYCYDNDYWPKEYDSCYLYGACKYLFLCAQKRSYGEEQLAGQYRIKEPWNVLDTVKPEKIVEVGGTTNEEER